MSLQNTFRLAISDDFFDAYSRLPRSIQSKVSEFINRFRQSPTSPGINYESIRNGKDKRMKSARIDQTYRAIVLKPEKGNVYILLWVDHHDKAYDWAQRKTCMVNEVSGALQIIDVEQAKSTTEQLIQANHNKKNSRFQKIKDKHLMQLGVPEILLPAVRQVITDDDVDKLLPHLPSEASDALILLAAGYELDAVFRELEKTRDVQQVNPDDFEKALENADSLSRFMVITDDNELEEMLAAPLEKWRVFLHPSQRKLVERNWSGAIRVLGGAGTGKTVVAMHRAKWLVQKSFVDPNDRILFTTFTRNLAVDIEANLKTICPPKLMQRIRVVNLDAWVSEFFRQEGIEIEIAYDQKTHEIWEDAYTLAPVDLGLSLNFYQEEWQDVVLAQDCQTLRDYLKARRVGRGTRLSRQKRQEIWPVLEEYRNLLREQNLREPDEAFRDAAKIIEAKGDETLPYKAVIVDEAQDMGPAAFTLLRAIAGKPKPNDMFIVGDAHQRIYGKLVTLSQCGIDIRGRSKKLRLNYRTTDETRRWATAILAGVTFDDLDGGTDSLNDYRSLMHGELPVIRGFEKLDDEIKFIQQTLHELKTEDNSLAGVCLAFRTNTLMEKFEAFLNEKEIPTKRIHRDQPDNPFEYGVRLGTMHRVKGLQFNYVFLPNLNFEVLPLQNGLNHCADETARQHFISGERSLLHVAATRAKKQVFASYHGQPSPLLSI
ncbi:UvrD/REP helicase (plasmid) [Thalassoporum mexicanum PCC 7367]|uniref:UvrD-helicase domain-containing protein n=1 Tax=Thalassoporum mexicanum TaxID=3457544 RepID=UPI00029FE141|nr:UvrD-helicase domain-containing protein [Pseudanabaena sp. PCC 7367]AFY71947.1 UvrD/REP helicase [Pseudanabaena sp. PCC 7367]